MALTPMQLKIFLYVVVPMLLIQSAWIFNDSRKRGEKYYWLWGLFGLLNIPGSLITYLVITRIIFKKK